MRTGSNGQIAISWTQTEIDGLEAAPLADLAVGRSWSWRGRGVQLTAEASQIAQHAGSTGLASVLMARAEVATPGGIGERAKIEFSNGAQTFVAELVHAVGETSLVLVFEDGCPEPGEDYWISAAASKIEPIEVDSGHDSKIVAFPVAQADATAVPVDLPRTVSWVAE